MFELQCRENRYYDIQICGLPKKDIIYDNYDDNNIIKKDIVSDLDIDEIRKQILLSKKKIITLPKDTFILHITDNITIKKIKNILQQRNISRSNNPNEYGITKRFNSDIFELLGKKWYITIRKIDINDDRSNRRNRRIHDRDSILIYVHCITKYCINCKINWKSVIFTWLCCIIDFISIFFIVSIIFYSVGHKEKNDISININNACNSIKIIYFYKIIICTLPLTIIGSIGINLYWTIYYITYSINNHNNIYYIIIYCIVITLFIQIIFIVGLCLVIMSIEIICLIWIIVLLTEVGLTDRFSNSSNIAQKFYIKCIKWIINTNKKSNKKIRLFSINKILKIYK